jgi:hypothetical protein
MNKETEKYYEIRRTQKVLKNLKKRYGEATKKLGSI